MSRRVTTLSVWVCGGVGLAAVSGADAAEWLVTPNARVMGDYVDNPRMLREGGESTSGAVAELSAGIMRRTDRTELSLLPRLRSSRYQDDRTLNSNDQYLGLAFKYATELTQWTLNADLTRDTTLTSELGSTGLVEANRRREGITLSGGPNVQLTERVSIGAQAYWMDNHYVDAKFIGLVDYQYRALSAFSSLFYSESSTLTLTAQGGELVVPDQDSKTRDGTLRLGWRYQPYSLWTVELSAGPSYVKSDFGSDVGEVVSLELQRQDELWSVNAKAARDLTPTGRGVLTRRDQVSVGLTRKLTQHLTGGGTLRWVRNQDLLPQAGVVFDEVTYGRVDLRADWRFAEHWSLALTVGGATQRYESRSGSAENYRASLSIVWNGQQQSL